MRNTNSLSKRISNSPEDTQTLLRQQALGSIVQPLDQSIGTAGSDDRCKFIASHGKIADGPVEIDVDHPSAADQIVYAHGCPARLQQPGFDDLATATGFRSCLRIDDEAFSRIIIYLACIVCHDEPCEGILYSHLLCRRETLPGRPDRQSRHRREVESGGNGRCKAPVTLAHSEPAGLPDCRHQIPIIALDVFRSSTRCLRPRWERAERDHCGYNRNSD